MYIMLRNITFYRSTCTCTYKWYMNMNMCQGYYSMCTNISDVKCCVHVHLYVPVLTCVFRGQVMADLGLGT